MTSRSIGGTVDSATHTLLSSRHRDRATRRIAANVVRRLRLLRGTVLLARVWDAEDMALYYNQ
jgi:hypothetical protein